MLGDIHKNKQELAEFLESLLETNSHQMTHLSVEKIGMDSNFAYIFEHTSLPFSIILYPIPYRDHRLSSGISDVPVPTIHVDEDIWISKKEIVKNRLRNRLALLSKIGGRNTVAARIQKPLAIDFQKRHHLHIPLPGKYRYGLFYHGDLIAVAVFSGGRKMRDEKEEYRSFELLRFCTKNGCQVAGGLSKLIKKFVLDFQPDDIMTYIDLDWGNHSNYRRIDFVQKQIIEPSCYGYDPLRQERLSPNRLDLSSDIAWIPKWNSGSIKIVKYLKY